jgi:hypothetical protein
MFHFFSAKSFLNGNFTDARRGSQAFVGAMNRLLFLE